MVAMAAPLTDVVGWPAMSADNVAVLVAAIAAAVGRAGAGRSWRWSSWAAVSASWPKPSSELRDETVPLVRDARVVVDQAATEMVRVGDVLDSAEAVSATVDSASRLAYRAFANPVVKVLAYGTGVGSAAAPLLLAPPADGPRARRSARGVGRDGRTAVPARRRRPDGRRRQ